MRSKKSQLVISIILVLVAISFSNCTTYKNQDQRIKLKQLPPGQAKSMEGKVPNVMHWDK
jgi:hypothetical protein